MNHSTNRQRSPESDLAVEVRDVRKSYQRGTAVTQVLKGVSFEVRRGECVFLLGPSGSGKSTLLSILGCILNPDSGSVRLLGETVSNFTQEDLIRFRRHRIGFVFQRFHLIRGLNAMENVAVPMTLQGMSHSESCSRAEELLCEVGLKDHLHSDPRNMSTGQCQRVALARALAGDPELILADEPTASLDGDSGHNVMSLLRGMMQKKGKTVIVVTHDQRILSYADRICEMDAGQLQQRPVDGTAENVSEQSITSPAVTDNGISSPEVPTSV